MKLHAKLAALSAVLALAASPALAVATAAPGKPSTPGPRASIHSKAKAYGAYCKGESRKHVSGQRGTPFSQCVTAMAKLATGRTSHARTACKSESRKHVSGEKGTPFSRCIKAAAKLEADDSSGSGDGTSSADSSTPGS